MVTSTVQECVVLRVTRASARRRGAPTTAKPSRLKRKVPVVHRSFLHGKWKMIHTTLTARARGRGAETAPPPLALAPQKLIK